MLREVFVFDTTCRDGEQGSGLRLTPAEKLQIAVKLAELGVKVIEVGFAASSVKDKEAIALVSREIRDCTICALSRAVISDIDACVEALEGATYPRIHTGIGVSLEHIMGKFGDGKYGGTLEEKQARILEMAVEAVRHAKRYVDDVEFYAEDAGRAIRGFLYKVLEGVIAAGATVVNIPDTTGYTLPSEFGGLIRDVFANVPNISSNVIVSVHSHNDLGMATATAMEGLLAGAGQVECTLNGYGERAGNTPLEEVVMAIHTRGKEFGLFTTVNTKQIKPASRLASRIFGIPVPPKKPIIGAKVLDHSSGIHQHGVLQRRDTYEIIRPVDIGADEGKIVLTARSGSTALRHRLLELGHELSDEQLLRAFKLFKMLADAKKQVDDDDLEDIAEMTLTSPSPDVFSIQSVSAGPDEESGEYKAVLQVVQNGQKSEWIGFAPDGPIDAAVQAIGAGTNTAFELMDYAAHSIGEGSDAIARVEVKIRHDGQTGRGLWFDTDTIKASAVAYAFAVLTAQETKPKE